MKFRDLCTISVALLYHYVSIYSFALTLGLCASGKGLTIGFDVAALNSTPSVSVPPPAPLPFR